MTIEYQGEPLRLKNIPRRVANPVVARRAFMLVKQGRTFAEAADGWGGPKNGVKASTIANYAIDHLRTSDYYGPDFDLLLRLHGRTVASYQDHIIYAIERNQGDCLMREIMAYIEMKEGSFDYDRKAMVYNCIRLVITDLCRKQCGVDNSCL
jgi:hypothetical protein